jgi:AraC-like DNA-binding protein
MNEVHATCGGFGPSRADEMLSALAAKGLYVWAIGMRNSLTLGADRALYLGTLPVSDWHAHAAPVLLVGLSGRFALRFPDGVVETCWSALLDAGQAHVFDSLGESIATVYLEPDSPEVRSLRFHFARTGGVVLDPVKRLSALNGVEQYLSAFDLSALLPWKIAPGEPVDRRLAAVLRRMRARHGGEFGGLDRDEASHIAGLSASRFNHLFSEQMGVSFRSYRVWSQVRGAIAALVTQSTLTHAAHDGGFADSSHFSHAFRKSFGNTPSSILNGLQSVVVLS